MKPFQALGGRITLLLDHTALKLALLLAILMVSLIALSLISGTYSLPIGDVWRTLFATAPSDTIDTIIWEFRFPRTVVAALAGALLALSGAILQNITRNPLADPSLVGISQGASLAVISLLILLPGWEGVSRPVVAFFGALLAAFAILWLSSGKTNSSTMRFILTGIGISAFLSALSLTMLTYGDIHQAEAALGWLAGSVNSAGWDDFTLLLVLMLALVPFLFWASRSMTGLRFGPEIGVGVGVRLQLERGLLLVLSVVLAATAVSCVGPLGFVGLVAPHIARRLSPSGIGHQLILTALVGALLVCCADVLGRCAFGGRQIPAGLLTSVFGAPIFLLILLRKHNGQQL